MATYTGIKAILEQFKTRMIKTKVNSAAQADNATNADKVDGYHVSNSSYPCLVPVTACSLGSTSGYIKLGNGLIVQWANQSFSERNEYTGSVTFSQISTLYGVSVTAKSRNSSQLNGCACSYYFSNHIVNYFLYGHDKNDRFIGASVIAIGF